MSDFKTEAIAFFTKWWAWFFYVTIGILAKLCFELTRRNKIPLSVTIGSAGMAAFVGFLASYWCITHSPENGAIIVPIATLLSDKIITFLFTMDYAKILELLNRLKG